MQCNENPKEEILVTASILDHFDALEEFRMERGKLHALPDLVVLAICAVAAGAEGWEAIAQFGRCKLDWLRQFIPLKNGAPSADCLAYVMQRLSPDGFRRCFQEWTESLAESTEGQVVAIDGKTVRGSRDRRRGRGPLHLVSAWAAHNRLVLGQEATEEKSNELTAIPRLLSILALKGCIVTIDAMGCQRAIAEQIVDQNADYVLALKENQPILSDAVKDFFATAEAADFAGVTYDAAQETDKGHGRVETRRYVITSNLETLPRREDWKGLNSIGMALRETWENDRHTVERRYFIASIAPDAKAFATAVRQHWGIENRLHWRLDVVFNEDASTIRKGNAPLILATLRHLVLNLFERAGSSAGLAAKRRRAAWDDDYRANGVFAR